MTTKTYRRAEKLVIRVEADTAGEAMRISDALLREIRSSLPTGAVIEYAEFDDEGDEA